MALTPLGPITVATPGTPVAVTTLPNIRCQTLFLQALKNAAHTNSGQVYILLGLTSGSAVRIATLGTPSTGNVPAFSATIPNAPGGLIAGQFWIDADMAGDGVDASYLGP